MYIISEEDVMENNKVKLTLWVDKRIHKAFKVVCAYRNMTLQKAVKHLMAFYVERDGILPKYDVDAAVQKVIRYAKIKSQEVDDIEGGLNEKEKSDQNGKERSSEGSEE